MPLCAHRRCSYSVNRAAFHHAAGGRAAAYQQKTIYTVYPSKEALLLDMVDHAFADIHRCKQEILAGSGTLQEKLRAVIIAMPTEYAALDLRQMKELDEKYPVVAARVRSQLENGWEPTMALLEQAVAEGGHAPGVPAGAAADDHRVH